MMHKKHFISLRSCRAAAAVVSLALLFLFGCSSGSEDLTASGGIGGTGVTVGEVSDYGSIFVNGIELDTRQAEIFVEGSLAGTGDQAAVTHLPIGQQVVVQGSITDDLNGAALRVDAFYRVIGPVLELETLDDRTLSLNVMGQTVFVDQETTLSGVSLATLATDMVLQISGLVDGSGAIHAGHISLVAEQMTADRPVAVKGRIQYLNEPQQRFQINALAVDYSQAQVAPDLLTEDRAVQIQGTLADDTLTASSVLPFDTESFDSVENFSVDGFITSPLGLNLWRMGDYRIRLDAATLFEGLEADDLTTGIRIRASGRMQNRELAVRRVTVATRVRMESTVATVDIPNRVIALAGAEATAIHVNFLTHIHGGALTMAGLAPGDHLRILAHRRDDQSVAAVTIFESMSDPQDDRFLLQGPVTEIAGEQFTVVATAIDTGANEDITFYGADGAAVTANAFLSALYPDVLARVTGRWESGQLVYEEMTILR
jgi:hypothetical protein